MDMKQIARHCLVYCKALLTMCLFIGAMNGAARAHAQDFTSGEFVQNFATDMPQEFKYNETEKGLFAFYTLLGSTPDFRTHIKRTQRYLDATPTDKVDFLREESKRLNAGYISYMADHDLLEFILPVTIQTSNYYQFSQKEGVETTVDISFDGLPEDYIPMIVGDYNIAIIPKDLLEKTYLTMDRDQYRKFAAPSGLAAHVYTRRVHAMAALKIRPLSIDKSGPVPMPDGTNMWLMLAEIGKLEVYEQKDGSPERKIMLETDADWFISDTERTLLNLYGGQ
jgi:hypothetical protein